MDTNTNYAKKRYCNICNFSTDKNHDYDRHISTNKHLLMVKRLMNTNENTLKNSDVQFFHCECKKVYKHMSSLCKHKKICNFKIYTLEQEKDHKYQKDQDNQEEHDKMLEVTQTQPIIQFNQELILEILKQNQEFKNLLVEQNKQIVEQNNKLMEISSNTTNNNCNITNNKFNLQIFLNEKCKDAPNFVDYINSIHLKLSDFDNFGSMGYTGSISNILLREFRSVDIYKRPIHCSDLKREVLHIKDQDTWKKDDDKEYMKKAIKIIAHKNVKQINAWVEANPESKDIQTKKHDQYMKILGNSMGEYEEADNEKNYEKIIRNVLKDVMVDKEK